MKAAARKLFNKRLKEIFPDSDRRMAFRSGFGYTMIETAAADGRAFIIRSQDTQNSELQS